MNWNHPTAPSPCQHKLELGCCCRAIRTRQEGSQLLGSELAPFPPRCIFSDGYVPVYMSSAYLKSKTHTDIVKGLSYRHRDHRGNTCSSLQFGFVAKFNWPHRLSQFISKGNSHSAVKGREHRRAKETMR